MAFNAHNWFHRDNIRCLTRLINFYNVKTIIEVGTWMGGSTRYMAEILPPDGIIYGVDTFEGSKAEKGT
jgi:predicted O-methyltransferase YrrM